MLKTFYRGYWHTEIPVQMIFKAVLVLFFLVLVMLHYMPQKGYQHADHHQTYFLNIYETDLC